jgi:DNA-binding XRE family transcriptional regulator
MKNDSQNDPQFRHAGSVCQLWLRACVCRAVDCPWEIFMTVGPGTSFAVLLRSLRKAAFLTQEDLAHAARLSSRAISDLERGLTRTTRRDTAHKLADALNLTGSSREDFVATACRRHGTH